MLARRRCSFSISVRAPIAVAATFLMIWPVGQASAQGLLDILFGRSQRKSTAPPSTAPTTAPLTLAYANPGKLANKIPTGRPAIPSQPSARSIQTVSYCVRLCDGRFFPMQHQHTAAQGQMCNAVCPASPTKVFRGGEIGRAVAIDGIRYSDLENAFVYRSRIVPACTCNGRDSFGLAPVDIHADPTLRAGDVVATQGGRVVFAGSSSKYGTNFTPNIDHTRPTTYLPRQLASQVAASPK